MLQLSSAAHSYDENLPTTLFAEDAICGHVRRGRRLVLVDAAHASSRALHALHPHPAMDRGGSYVAGVGSHATQICAPSRRATGLTSVNAQPISTWATLRNTWKLLAIRLRRIHHSANDD